MSESASSQELDGVAVAVRGLTKAYGGTRVVEDVSFEVGRGERFVIMGPSGSGKSTLLKMLIGLEAPDEGEILIEGEPVSSEGLQDRYRMSMVFQSGALLSSLNVEQNVGIYLFEHQLKPVDEIRRIVADRLALVDLEGTQHKEISELSGGMKKRVAIARAMVMDPQLILYDEPTSELDPITAATVGQEIFKMNEQTGATSIIVTHDRALGLGIADRLAVMRRGRVLKIGTLEDVTNSGDQQIDDFLNADFKKQAEKKATVAAQ